MYMPVSRPWGCELRAQAEIQRREVLHAQREAEMMERLAKQEAELKQKFQVESNRTIAEENRTAAMEIRRY